MPKKCRNKKPVTWLLMLRIVDIKNILAIAFFGVMIIMFRFSLKIILGVVSGV